MATGRAVGRDRFFDAVGRGDLGEVKRALECGVDVNGINADGLTALHLAALVGASPMVVRELIKYGARVDVRDDQDHTPLELVQDVNSEVRKLLHDASDARSDGKGRGV